MISKTNDRIQKEIAKKIKNAEKELDKVILFKSPYQKRVLKNPGVGITFFGFAGDCKGKSGIPHHKDPKN